MFTTCLGSEAVLYLITLALSIPLFPLLWNKSFFTGIHWRGETALQLGWRVPAIAAGCFVLAGLDQWLLPGPEHAPIEEIFRSPGAAWLMFAFGVTFAPFFEEMSSADFCCLPWPRPGTGQSKRASANQPLPSTPTAIPSGPSSPW